MGVKGDDSKIEVVKNWPAPNTVKVLIGFLGLTEYYKKLRNYGLIAKPLTEIPVLQLPNFKKVLWLKVMLATMGYELQHGHPIAYLSKALGPKNLGYSVYEKEFLAILLAIQKWRSYLVCGTFIIKTDQKALKHLLE